MTRPAAWLDSLSPSSALGVSIVRRALGDVGICEDPLNSNSSPEIDDYLKRLAVPLGSPWCAAAVTEWFRSAGAKVPAGPGASSTNEWLRWAKEHGLFTPTPGIGYAVIYGKKGENGEQDHAEHIGVVVRLVPLLMSVEGNTSLGGASVREGITVDVKKINEAWRLGYVRPVAQ